MSVERIELPIPPARIPHHLEVLLDETSGPLSEWQSDSDLHTFVPADYVLVFDALMALRPQMVSRPPKFVEWGSGFGIATILASALGWKASGIEIQPPLVEESRAIASAFGFTPTFHEGSFFPSDQQVIKKLDSLCAEAEVIYVYPWPDQEVEIFDLFDRKASPGAWLMAYYGIEDLRIFRKQGSFTTPSPSGSPTA